MQKTPSQRSAPGQPPRSCTLIWPKMPDDMNDAKDALATLGAGPAAKELYVDLLRPAAKELGANLHTVARAITIAMAPLRGLIWGFEKVHDWLEAALLRRLAGSDPEQTQTTPPYLAGPT